jgi:RimJ/RimL family protein N-acetyltransferase
MELNTERTRLIPITIDIINNIENGSLNDNNSYDFHYNDEWPEDDLYEAIPVFRNLLEMNGTDGFNLWIIIFKKTNMIIGSAGYIGRPDDSGDVEIGFGVIPSAYGRGFCSEAVRALVDWGLQDNDVKSIVAHCSPHNAASQKVVEKLGFKFIKEDDNLQEWRMTK